MNFRQHVTRDGLRDTLQRNAIKMTLRRTIALAFFAATTAAVAVAAQDFVCPEFSDAKAMRVLMTCLDDPDGLCGSQCVDALVKGALAVKDDIAVPCEGGIDGVVENVLKKCTEEAGQPFDPCDGAFAEQLRANAASVRCIGGGTLESTLES